MASVEASPWRTDVDQVPPQVLGHPRPHSDGTAGGLRMRGRVAHATSMEDDDDDDDEGAVDQEVPGPEEKRQGTILAIVAFLDVISSTGVFISCFSYAYRAAGVSLWSMGIQAMSHVLSSVLLTLRFFGENALPNEASAQGLIRKRRRRFLVREQVVSVTMGLVMLLSSAALLFKAFRKMRFWNKWYEDQALRQQMDAEVQWVTEFLAWYGFSWYFVQAGFRFWGARKLRRSIVWHAFVASVVSVLFLLVLGLAASYQKEWSWKAEPIAAIVLAFVTLAEAIRIVIMHLDDMDTRLRHDPRA